MCEHTHACVKCVTVRGPVHTCMHVCLRFFSRAVKAKKSRLPWGNQGKEGEARRCEFPSALTEGKAVN